MPVPNNSRATALALTLDASVTVDLADLDAVNGAWYYVTVPGAVYYIGLQVLTDDNFPFMYSYTNASLTRNALEIDMEDPVQQPVQPADRLYLQFLPSNDGNPPGTLGTFTATACPVDTLNPGDLLITDDTLGFPALALTPNGTIRRSIPIGSGEAGDILPDGRIAVYSLEVGGGVDMRFYAADFALVANIAAPGNTVQAVMGDQVNHFYYAPQVLGASPVVVYRATGDGVQDSTTWTLPGSALQALCPAIGGHRLYWTGSDGVIGVWNLDTDAAAPDLAAAITNYRPRDICVLQDDTIVVAYSNKNSPFDSFIRQYNPSGTVLQTHIVSDGSVFDWDHLCRSAQGAASMIIWLESRVVPKQSKINRIALVGGTVLETLTVYIFETGFGPAAATGVQIFGPSASCPIMALQVAVAPPNPGNVTGTGGLIEGLGQTGGSGQVNNMQGLPGCPVAFPAGFVPLL